MKPWMTAVGIVAGGVIAIAAVVTMAAAQPGYGAGAHGGRGHSDYRAVDRWLKEFDQVVGEGRGFGLAFAADQHGYPGPMHVLELKDLLGLTPEQETRVRALMQGMFAESRPESARLLDAEARLRALFAGGGADEAAVRTATA